MKASFSNLTTCDALEVDICDNTGAAITIHTAFGSYKVYGDGAVYYIDSAELQRMYVPIPDTAEVA